MKFLRDKKEIGLDYLNDLIRLGIIEKKQYEYYSTIGLPEILDLLDKKVHETEILDGVNIATLDAFYHFCNYIVNKDFATGRKVWNSFVIRMFNVVEHNQYSAVAAARGHGKSFYWCLYTLFKSYTNPYFECIIASNTPKMGKRLFRVLNRLIDSNELLAIQRNPDKKQDIPNTQFEMEYNHGYFEVTSVGTTPRSAHVNLAIADDPLRDDKRYSDDFIENYVFGQLFPITQIKKGRLIISGTIMSYTDIFHNIMKDKNKNLIRDGRVSEGKHAGFYSIFFPAVLDEKTKEVLLPELFTYDDLMRIKNTQGDFFFMREYMLQCIDDNKALFPHSLIRRCTDETITVLYTGEEDKSYIISADVATSGEASADFTVATVIELKSSDKKQYIMDEDNKMIEVENYVSDKVVRYVYREKGVPVRTQVDILQDLSIRFNNAPVIVEKNNVGVALIQDLERRNVHVEAFVTDKFKKESIIRYLINEMQNSRVWFPEETDEIKAMKEELRQFGVREVRGKERMEAFSAHDDSLLEGTGVITNSGIKNIEDIKQGDYVLTHNKQFKAVETTMSKTCTRDIITIKPIGNLKFSLTDKHKLFIIDNTDKKEQKTIFELESQLLDKNKHLLISPIDKEIINLKKIDMTHFFPTTAGWCYNDAYYWNIRWKQKRYKRFIEINDDFCFFIGWYVGDGSSKNLVFNHKDSILQKKIINYLISLGINIRINEIKPNFSTFDFCCIPFQNFLKLNCLKRENKKLPDFTLKLPYNLQKEIICGYFEADGSLVRGRMTCNTISKVLAYQIRDLFLRNNIICLLNEVKRHRYDVQNKNQYVIEVSKYYTNLFNNNEKKGLNNVKSFIWNDYLITPINWIKIEKNQLNNVYDLQVKDDRSYCPNGIMIRNCVMSLAIGIHGTTLTAGGLAFAISQD